jgi:hypothetical protein
MRPILYVVVGFVVLIFLGILMLGGGIAWITGAATTAKVDVEDPKAVDKFKATFESNCTRIASNHMGNPDYQQVALIKQVCACDGKALVNYMKKKKDMTVLEVQAALLKQDPALVREFNSCAQAYGIDDVQPY